MSTTFRQRERGVMIYPRSGWRKLLFRWPIVFWRLGLAPLIGRFFLLPPLAAGLGLWLLCRGRNVS